MVPRCSTIAFEFRLAHDLKMCCVGLAWNISHLHEVTRLYLSDRVTDAVPGQGELCHAGKDH